jgi:hypothetical protein
MNLDQLIMSKSLSVPSLGSGVFILFKNHRAVFIGSSAKFTAAVLIKHRNKDCDDLRFLRVPPKDRRLVESAFIQILCPKYNRVNRWVDDARKVAEAALNRYVK